MQSTQTPTPLSQTLLNGLQVTSDLHAVAGTHFWSMHSALPPGQSGVVMHATHALVALSHTPNAHGAAVLHGGLALPQPAMGAWMQ